MIPWLVVAAAVALSIRRFFLGYPKGEKPFVVIARRDAAFLEAAAETLFPDGGAIPLSGREADIPSYVDGMLELLPRHLRIQIRVLFLLVEHGTLVFPAAGRGGFRRFSALRSEQRTAVLAAWSRSRWFARRMAFTALRAVLTMGYLGHPATLRHLRLAPYAIDTPVCEADLLYPRVGSHPDSIEFTPADLTPPSDGSPMDLDGPLHPAFTGARRDASRPAAQSLRECS